MSGNTYLWTPGSALNFDTILTPVVGLTQNTVFNLNVTSAQGCVKTGSVNVSLAAEFPANVTIIGDTVMCTGENVPLMVDLGGLTAICGISTSAPLGSVKYAVIGTGTATNATTSYPAPYSRLHTGSIHQILFRASELHAMGMGKGRISSLSFYVTTIGTMNTLNNYEVRMKCTSQNELTMTFETGFTVVSPATTHIVQTGWNEHVFATPYEWDGVSNLLMQFCTQNATNSPTGSSLTRYTNTSYNSVGYDGSNAVGVCNTTIGLISTKRPNVRFKYTSIIADPLAYTYLWSPNNGSIDTNSISTPIVTPAVSTIYNVIIMDTLSGCLDTVSKYIEVVNAYNAGFSHNSPYCFNDPIDVFVPVYSGGTFTGSGVASSGSFNPATAGVGTWPINYNTSSGNACNNDSIMLIQVLPLPDPTITEVEVCINSSAVTLVTNTPGGLWWGTGISDSLLGTFNPSNLTAGDYQVYYKVTTSCTDIDTATIKVILPYSFSFNGSVNVCNGSTIDLSSSYTLSGNPLQGSGPVLAVWSDVNGYVNASGLFDATGVPSGSYQVTLEVTGMDGSCGVIQSMNVMVHDLDYATLPFGSSFCTNQISAKLFVDPWLYGTGVSYTQTPLGSLSANDTLIITPFGQNGKFDASLRGEGSWEIEFTRMNSNGCVGVTKDTIYVLTMPSNTVSNDGHTITANAIGGYTYQWLNCNNGNAPIAGATNQSYTPSVAGKYAVEISAGSCKATSSCEDTWPLSVANIVTDLGVSLYPNPIQNELRIDKGNNGELTIEITDNTGKVVFQKTATAQLTLVDMSDLASGIYIVKMSNNNGTAIEKVVKK